VYGLTFQDIEYDYSTVVNGTSKEVNPYEEPTVLLSYHKNKVTHVRDSVKWLQWELLEAGYTLAIDGMFGVKTNQALGLFQKSCKIDCDHILGPITRRYLKEDVG
jgi:peptidoglycan hydrolase-like protein with peptidoglycan-binding domain